MTKEQRQRSDYEAIIWAWKIIKESGDPQPADEYWDELIRLVSEMIKNQNVLYKHLGMAILNAMEDRQKQKGAANDIIRNNG